VIAVSDQDKEKLLREDPSLIVEVVPIILPLPRPIPARDASSCDLIFVGNFEHAPNIDATVFLCGEIFPAIKAQIPYATLKIVGNSPNEAVLKLASEDVKVLGFVPDIRTCYECSDISVAPLTWGGGLKVKIAEAMSYGLPVVATSVGIDGLGLRPGEDVVLGNTPTEFVEGVTKLHQDPICYEKIRTNGWKFIEASYSVQAVKRRIDAVFDKLEQCPVKRLPFPKLVKRGAPDFVARHLLWRFRRVNLS